MGNKFLKLGCVIVLILLSSCQSNLDKIQGVFTVDKESLKATAKQKIDTNNLLATALTGKILENAIIEFKVKGDSLNGLLFFAGQSNVLQSKIEVVNDSLLIKVGDDPTYLIANEKGMLFKKKSSSEGLQMLRSPQSQLSDQTIAAVKELAKKEKEEREFEESMGQWRRGNYVDEFGDRTGEGFPFSIVRASHENSIVTSSEVYVKTVMAEDGLYFQIFNTSMTMKENLPDSKFGYIRIKFPDGEVKQEKVFFYKNSVTEYSGTSTPLIFNHLMKEDGELKILIDVSTAEEYYSDKYQFALKRANLGEMMK